MNIFEEANHVTIGYLRIDREFDREGELCFDSGPCTSSYLNRKEVEYLRDLLTKLLEGDGE